MKIGLVYAMTGEIESLRRDYDALWERMGEVLKQLAELVVM